MKITSVQAFLVRPRWCMVKIETDAGICGWGEAVLEGEATVRVERAFAPDAAGVERFDAIHARYTGARTALAGLEGAA